MDWPQIIGVLLGLFGLVISVLSLRMARRKESTEELQKRIDSSLGTALAPILARIVAAETKLEIFWKGVSFSASQVLHSPHTPELDRLIEKFQQDDIDDRELRRFKKMLREVVEDEDRTPLQRKAARDVLTLIKIRYEIVTSGI